VKAVDDTNASSAGSNHSASVGRRPAANSAPRSLSEKLKMTASRFARRQHVGHRLDSQRRQRAARLGSGPSRPATTNRVWRSSSIDAAWPSAWMTSLPMMPLTRGTAPV